MSKVRTFKARAGLSVYCESGDIHFTDEFYSTDDPKKLKSLERSRSCEEVDGKPDADETTDADLKPLGADEDIETMTGKRCVEVLTLANVAVANGAKVAQLRELVKGLPQD